MDCLASRVVPPAELGDHLAEIAGLGRADHGAAELGGDGLSDHAGELGGRIRQFLVGELLGLDGRGAEYLLNGLGYGHCSSPSWSPWYTVAPSAPRWRPRRWGRRVSPLDLP